MEWIEKWYVNRKKKEVMPWTLEVNNVKLFKTKYLVLRPVDTSPPSRF